MQLYCCGTYYQLLNAINLKNSLFAHEPADLILMDSTDFQKQVDGLKEHPIFDQILVAHGSWENDRTFKSATYSEKKRMSGDWSKLLGLSLEKKPYDQLFIGAQTPYFKFLYYSLCDQGIYPDVYLLEDGIYSYVLDFIEDCECDGFPHTRYKKHDIRNHVQAIYGYGTNEMYFGSREIEYRQIPRIDCTKLGNRKMYQDLWGRQMLPKEKYIFLEEGMFQDHLINSDTYLLEQIADIVGKDNIIVKRHPRCTYDRFSSRGFKVVSASDFPWEVALMEEKAEEKVLLSISSTATITPQLVLGKYIPAVQLFKMKPYGAAGPHCANRNYRKYFACVYQYLNQEKRQLFSPASLEELKENLTYIDYMRWRRDECQR